MGKQPNVDPAEPQSSRPMLRQMSMAFDTIELQGISAAQRAITTRHLANLLMHAAGVATEKERDDDER
ncbi:hypothetical protein P5W98_03605 [Paraburkholderia sp. A1BS-2L]|uniref:hypothetical protein n=1 Tax=Paraburkholderia TaxID=1822464 RepID=UPI001BCBC421|nr:hypothetical protein [Paraburkholderia sacchari]